MTELTIPARFNGPPGSGNGGYSCGVLAAHVAGPARVRLHAPPPLDTPLRVATVEGGGVELYDGSTLIGTAGSADVRLEVPPAPSLDEARAAMAHYVGYEGHLFPTCFVCGPGRPEGDGLELFPGPVAGRDVFACVWQPAEDLLDASGCVRPEIVWAALDCPGYFGAVGGTLRKAVLGQLEGAIDRPVPGGEPLVVYAWGLGAEGRKLYGGAAIATARGDVLASSRSTWIELRD